MKDAEIFLQEIKTFKEKHKIIDVPYYNIMERIFQKINRFFLENGTLLFLTLSGGRCPGFRNRKALYRIIQNQYPLSKLVWVDWRYLFETWSVKTKGNSKKLYGLYANSYRRRWKNQKTEVKNFCLLSRRICAKKEKYYVASFS